MTMLLAYLAGRVLFRTRTGRPAMGLLGGARPPRPPAQPTITLDRGDRVPLNLDVIDTYLAGHGTQHRLTTSDIDRLLDARRAITQEQAWQAMTSDTSTAPNEPAK